MLVDAPEVLHCVEVGNGLGFPVIGSTVARLDEDPERVVSLDSKQV